MSIVGRYRKFLPQLAYVLLAGWTLVADRLDDGQGIDGVTVLAVVVAVAQALAVVVPRNADIKAGASLVIALAQGVTAAWSDHAISVAEYTVLVSAFLAWAAGAAVTNHPPDPPDDQAGTHTLPGIRLLPVPDDDGPKHLDEG